MLRASEGFAQVAPVAPPPNAPDAPAVAPVTPPAAPPVTPDAEAPTEPSGETPPSEPDAAPGPDAVDTAPAPPQEEAAPPADSGVSLTPQLTPTATSGAPKEAKEEEPQQRPGLFAEDWWSHARPVFEFHGNFRVRAGLFNKFALNRRDTPTSALWPQPADNQYTAVTNSEVYGPQKCTPSEAGSGSETNPAGIPVGCKNNTQAGANLRFRLMPELFISDNLRVLSQVDLLDNLVLGSTPDSYSVTPSANGYAVRSPDGNAAPNSSQASTAVPPTSGVNSLSDSIAVKRAWAEYATPIGELRFGRMPNNWGLGMLYNSGDGYDDDYQSTVDRILFATGIAPLDLMVAGAWDFPSEGATSSSLSTRSGQPYDVAQADDVNELVLIVARKKSQELETLALTQGDVVFNTGLHLTRRSQQLTDDLSGAGNATTAGAGTCQMGGAALDCPPGTLTFERRGLTVWTPDLWLQLLYKKFRYEFEFAAIYGSLENSTNVASNYTAAPGGEGFKIRQYGFASEIEQKLVEDRLKLGFNFGWASGDPDEAGLLPPSSGVVTQQGDDTFSTFRFNPSYRVDMILNRNILGRIQGTYYVRPSVSYDILRSPNGQRLGGQFAAIWTRASEFIQAPGNARDLGIELNGTVTFQSKDGSRNDKPEEMGGFFTALQYGVLFPMSGLDHLPQEQGPSTSAAQILRWHLGVLF